MDNCATTRGSRVTRASSPSSVGVSHRHSLSASWPYKRRRGSAPDNSISYAFPNRLPISRLINNAISWRVSTKSAKRCRSRRTRGCSRQAPAHHDTSRPRPPRRPPRTVCAQSSFTNSTRRGSALSEWCRRSQHGVPHHEYAFSMSNRRQVAANRWLYRVRNMRANQSSGADHRLT